jgi:acyl carrier protein
MNLIFNKVREILHQSYSINYDQIELETKFELELGMDSREFFELIVDFENVFKINIFFESKFKRIIANCIKFYQKCK